MPKCAREMGISRRISAIPRGFRLREHYVFLAQPKMKEIVDPQTGDVHWIGGVFRIFKPALIEKIITVGQSHNEAEMKKLELAGITPVIVPDNDSDHRGSVYDNEEQGELFTA
jgi:hypothetical protein